MNKAYPYDFLSARYVAEDGTFINFSDYLRDNTTFFNDSKVTSKNTQLILNANIPLSSRRDVQTETNGGTVEKVGPEYRVRASSTTNSFAQLQTVQRGEYISGNVFETGMGIRIPEQPTGDATIKWGYFKGDTGIYYLYDSTGLYVVIEDNGTEILKKEQSEWNVDNFSGNDDSDNGSGYDLDLTAGLVFQITFIYYGYGPVIFQIQGEGDQNYRIIKAHSFNRTDGAITISEPNLPISVEVDSGTTGTQLDCFVGGRQISTYGAVDPVGRTVGAVREAQSVGTSSLVPLVSFRRKTGYENILTELRSLDIISNQNMTYAILMDANLTGASWQTPPHYVANEVANEFDISATSLSGGEALKTGLVGGAQGNSLSLTSNQLPDRKVGEDVTVTLAAKGISNSATVSSQLELDENW